MGEHSVQETIDPEQVRAFTQAILRDLRALEAVLQSDLIERGVRRVGVEQEMFIVDADYRPLPIAHELQAALGDSRFTTELARFNFEANLTPRFLHGSFLKELEVDLQDVLDTVRRCAESFDAHVLLTGILPTLRHEDLGLGNLTPESRFRQMNNAISRLRGGSFPVRISGIEDFETVHDSVMIESANTSLQLHLQVGPEEFSRLYNLAQLITAPLLAAATNSPVLLGRRLWHETRVALFERAIDERSSAQMERGLLSRVSFGDNWVRDSALEIFRENLARFHVIMTRNPGPDPMAAVKLGAPPDLSALMLHNGTVWRWNRPCYGVADGVAHLRIENRVLPAGPTVLDEVANAALFYGMMLALDTRYGDVSSNVSFNDIKVTFVAAAQHGIKAGFTWIDGRTVAARDLLLNELIPAAEEGLQSVSAPAEDIDRYLGTIRERCAAGRTGSSWLLDCLALADDRLSPNARMKAITAAMHLRQGSGEPVHRWKPLQLNEHGRERARAETVADIMSSDLFTVLPEDVLDLATSVMEWKHIRHVPVEDAGGRLVGLLSHRALLRVYPQQGKEGGGVPIAIESVMERNPAAVSPDCGLMEAMAKLLGSDSGCLLVTSGDRLVGIVTERDFVEVAMELLGGPREPRGGDR